MSQIMHGKVRGTTIELYQPVGIPDGQEVELTLRMVPAVVDPRHPGEGIRRSAGPLPDDSEQDDLLLGEIQRMRKSSRGRQVAE